MTKLELIKTGDGSMSLLNTELNETYHSIHGALRESLHVFIEQGLNHFLSQHQIPCINIFEVGFGTGLNAFLTASRAAQIQSSVHYTSVETFPLEKAVWQQLSYPSSNAERLLFERLHEAKWNTPVNITEHFILEKKKASLQQVPLSANHYHIIYFDAFAPSKQPEMWELPVLKKVYDCLVHHGMLVTYCAKGQLKRDLKSMGFEVQTLPGPPGKKEMVRAVKV